MHYRQSWQPQDKALRESEELQNSPRLTPSATPPRCRACTQKSQASAALANPESPAPTANLPPVFGQEPQSSAAPANPPLKFGQAPAAPPTHSLYLDKLQLPQPIHRLDSGTHGESWLQPKGRGQGIMASEFLLSSDRLNLSLLFQEKRDEIITKTGLTVTAAVELFEYGKNHEGYWDGVKLHEQVISKALPVAEAFYPGYALLFLFDNATSHSVYAKNALRTKDMNKGIGDQQAQLGNGWYENDGIKHDQPMSFQKVNGNWTQKGIQQVLEEQNLWPVGGVNLECL